MYFDNLDIYITLQFRIIPYEKYLNLNYRLKYSCVIFNIDYNDFAKCNLSIANKIINKQPENMFRDYPIMNFY